jgi:DNA-binding XRE family transcriptional regulator
MHDLRKSDLTLGRSARPDPMNAAEPTMVPPPAPAGTATLEPPREAECPGPPLAARVRAARAAADLSREELARRIGSSPRAVRRIEDGGRRAHPEELERIAVACGVPEWFLRHGWSGWERQVPLRLED